jgi:mannose-6-phosphate isomerase-like protein (cupin superfamily)
VLHIAHGDVPPFDFHGLRIVDYTRQLVPSASVAHIAVEPGVQHPTTRSTRSDKFYYCLAGPISFVVQDEAIVLGTGDVLVIAKNEWFSYTNATERDVRLLLIHVPCFDLAAEEFRGGSGV